MKIYPHSNTFKTKIDRNHNTNPAFKANLLIKGPYESIIFDASHPEANILFLNSASNPIKTISAKIGDSVIGEVSTSQSYTELVEKVSLAFNKARKDVKSKLYHTIEVR